MGCIFEIKHKSIAFILCVVWLLLWSSGMPRSVFAASGDFVIEGGILRAYNGDEDAVVIPAGVKAIGPGVFSGKKLSQVTIGGGVSTIGARAFYNCENLSRVTIEEGVENIDMSAFADCQSLYLINIPASVRYIAPGVFAGDRQLSNLAVAAGNRDYFFNDGVLYNRDSTELVQYLAGRKSTWFQIPFTVKKIDRYAFWGATLLTRVRISNNVPEIPDHAFSNCIGLTTIYLPESVKRLGDYSFSDCVNLYYVAMERDDVKIEKTAFDGCNKNLNYKGGVSEKDALEQAAEQEKTVKTVSGDSAVSQNGAKKGGGKKSAAGDDKAGDDGGRVSRTKNGYSYTRVPAAPQNPKESSDDSLWGQSRVSGGKVLIIPKK